MKINVLYFAQLSDLAERKAEQLETEESSPEKIYMYLKNKYTFPYDFESLQVAINHKLSAHHQILLDGDELAFLPPMTGG